MNAQQIGGCRGIVQRVVQGRFRTAVTQPRPKTARTGGPRIRRSRVRPRSIREPRWASAWETPAASGPPISSGGGRCSGPMHRREPQCTCSTALQVRGHCRASPAAKFGERGRSESSRRIVGIGGRGKNRSAKQRNVLHSLAQRRNVNLEHGQAKIQILAKVAVANWCCSSRLVAVMARKAICRGRVSPTGVTSCCSSTRSSLTCTLGGMSAASSKKTVAPSANSSKPCRADVGAGEGAAHVAEQLALDQRGT